MLTFETNVIKQPNLVPVNRSEEEEEEEEGEGPLFPVAYKKNQKTDSINAWVVFGMLLSLSS